MGSERKVAGRDESGNPNVEVSPLTQRSGVKEFNSCYLPSWSDGTLGGLVRLQRGHDLTEPERRSGSVPVMGSAGQNGFHDEAKAPGPGVVIGRSGASIGRVHFTATDYWPHNTCLYVTDFLGNNPRFVYYLLKTLDLAGYNSGSAQPSLNRNYIYGAQVRIPPRAEQDAIASTLDALDHRIEFLRQTNTTLEVIAQALFKSWFIDFDPVHAKAEGREPDGMDAATATLFPNSFEDSPLGPIPQGWRTDEIGNVVSCIGGATPSTKEPSFWEPAEHHWVTPKDLSGLAAPVLMDTSRKVSTVGLKKISSGTLPTGTLLLSSRAPIGYLAITQIPTAINQGFIAMPPGGELSPAYLLFWTQSNKDSIKQKANGSTFMEISKSAFRPIKLCVPPKKIVTAFASIAEPLLERISVNEAQRTQLAQLRDTLLPRLISGKLRLPAQALIEEATP